MAETEIASWLARVSGSLKTISKSSLAQSVQVSLENLNKSGWVRNWQYAANGKVYENSTSILPIKTLGYYKEYDIYQPTSAATRGLERFVKGADGEIYYTNNHFGDVINGEPIFYKVQ